MTNILEVLLGDNVIGRLTLLSGDRSFFTFDDTYLNDQNRDVLSQSFFTQKGGIIPETKIVQTKLPPFFSNLLPEGYLRTYLAQRGGIKSAREFKLIELLGDDLPGAITVRAIDGYGSVQQHENDLDLNEQDLPYRFSLAGVQLKFSAIAESSGGLTIPARGVGGDWIIKLPAQNFSHVPENEWAMLHFASQVGITAPETRLVDLKDIAGLPDMGALQGNSVLAVKRFDREQGGKRTHIEDFAQIYNLFPDAKYRNVSYANIANMVWMLTGEEGLTEYIKRLVFNIVIGNGDMHLKNWSLIYPDGKTPELSPAYDFVSTIPYIPNDKLALNLADSKDMTNINLGHFKKLVKKAGLPEFLVLNIVKSTIQETYDAWDAHKTHYVLSQDIIGRIDAHMKHLALQYI